MRQIPETFDRYEIIEKNIDNNKAKIKNNKGEVLIIPFSLNGYESTIELIKLKSPQGENVFSLKTHKETDYIYGLNYTFKIIRKKEENIKGVQKKFFEVTNKRNQSFRISVRYKDYLNYQIGDEITCCIVRLYPDKVFLQLVPSPNLNLELGIEYKFNLVDFVEITNFREDLCILLIRNEEQKYFEVIGPSWQKWHRSEIDEIHCCVKDSSPEKLTQTYSKQKHPLFEVGKAYEFVYKKDVESTGRSIEVYGPDNCIYTTARPFIYHSKFINPNQKIKLFYLGLSKEYGTIKTKFFISFEDIIKDFRALKRITFDSLRKEYNNNEDYDTILSKLFRDFDNYENLWVISFCEVLRSRIDKYLFDKDFETALIFIDVLLKVEEWILNSGFLNSFWSKTRDKTSIVAVTEIDLLKRESRALEIILDEKIDNYDNYKPKSNDLKHWEANEIYVQLFVIKHLEFASSNKVNKVANFLFEIGKSGFFRKERNSIDIAVYILEKIKLFFEKTIFSGVFINSEKRKNFYSNNLDLKVYKTVAFISLLIHLDNNNNIGVCCNLFKILRLYSLNEESDEKQYQIISAAIRLTSVSSNNLVDHIAGVFGWNQPNIIFNFLDKELKLDGEKKFKNLNDIKASFDNSSYIRVRVTDNSWLGYELHYKEDRLILPFFNCYRKYKKGESIDVIVYLIDEDFGQALTRTYLDFQVIPKNQIIEIGSNVVGRVKRVEDFGIFVNLGMKDGLIPNKELSSQYIPDNTNLLEFGDSVECKVLDITDEGDLSKITLSRKAVIQDKIKDLQLQEIPYSARITNIDEDYGIFIELDNGYDGLIRKDEISWNYIPVLIDAYDLGQSINAKFLHQSNNKHYFSLKKVINKNPFANKKLLGTKFNASILGSLTFEQWAFDYLVDYEKFNNQSQKQGYKAYCPFCYRNSTYNYKNKFDRATEKKSLIISSNKRKWSCENCGYTDTEVMLLYLSDLCCTATFDLNSLHDKEYNKIKKNTRKKDLVDVTIKSIILNEDVIKVDLDLLSFKKGSLKNQILHSERSVAFEIAGCYEQYAFLQNSFLKRITYLDWAKYYYGIGKSAKSYYLDAYINYINIVTSLIENDHLNENFKVLVEKIKSLINEVEARANVLEPFPIMEKIVLLLKILSNFKTQSEESHKFLLNVSLSESEPEHDYIKNLAAAILSFNLLNTDSSKFLIQSLKDQILLLLKRSLASFANDDLDAEDVNRKILVEKLINKGEDFNVEFKASLDVPVLSKEIKIAIRFQNSLLENAKNDEEIKLINTKIKELQNINAADKRLIEIVNISIIKTIAAFANSGGGFLLVGVDEDEEGNPYVLGIEKDLKKHKNKDGIKLKFDGLIQKYFGNGVIHQLIKSMSFINFKGKEIILIEVTKSDAEVFVNTTENKKFFIRRQASTVELNSYDLYEFLNAKNRELQKA